MLKKILIITCYILLFGAVCAYFVFSTIITRSKQRNETCKEIKVIIRDSAQIKFISSQEIVGLIAENGITAGESRLRHINNNQLELMLNKKTAVKNSEVSYTRDGVLRVDISQRKPILRLETINGGFYMDETSYIFPLVNSYAPFVPIVSGEIPLTILPGYHGIVKDNIEWAMALRDLGIYIAERDCWNTLVEQIYVDEKGILNIIPRTGDYEIIFGNLEKIDNKFRKLYAFYKDILPSAGEEKYCSVNLQFDNQIVCKKNNKTDKNIQL